MQRSLRHYLTESELKDYQPQILKVDNQELIQAEIDIDNIIAVFYQGTFSRAYKHDVVFQNCEFQGQTATIGGMSSQSDGLYNRVLVEILEGTNKGSRYLIKEQIGATVTFYEDTKLNENAPVRVFQLAKLPFSKDVVTYNSKYTKLIDENVKQAVAYQYVHRVNNPDLFSARHVISSESLNGEDYSFTYDTKKPMSMKERISPQALYILDFLIPQTTF